MGVLRLAGTGVLGFYCPATGFYCPLSALFQSRSGFLLSCDDATAANQREAVSIPFWVSTVLRPYSATELSSRGQDCFNPVLGFYCPATVTPTNNHREPVSIPFWVSTVLRPWASATISLGNCFNPVLGFYCPATASLWIVWWTRRCFNPVLGFYCPATDAPAASSWLVSIPFWVSTVLRPTVRRLLGECEGFNPVLGFYPAFWVSTVLRPFWVSTVLRPAVRRRRRLAGCFNPVLGFYCPATVWLRPVG